MTKKQIDKNQVAITVFVVLAVIVGVFIVSKGDGFVGEAGRVSEPFGTRPDGSACTRDSQCVSGICFNRVCSSAPVVIRVAGVYPDGSSCRDHVNCRSTFCGQRGTEKVCGTPDTRRAGARCRINEECLSGLCGYNYDGRTAWHSCHNPGQDRTGISCLYDRECASGRCIVTYERDSLGFNNLIKAECA